MKTTVSFIVAALLFACPSWSAEPKAITPIRVSMADQADCRVSTSGDYEDTLSAIACVFAREFNLSVHGIYVLFHSNERAFESSLASANKFDATYARQTATWAVALSTTERIFVNEAVLSRLPWPEQIRVLAHELAHTAQYRLAGGRKSTSDQWLREGVAEWMASSIVDSLKLAPLAKRKALALARVSKAGRDGALPALHRMVTFYDFAALRSTLGNPATYDQAFIAADFLIQCCGLPSILQYFRLFGQSDDRLQNFRTAFGKDLSTFEDEFRLHVRGQYH